MHVFKMADRSGDLAAAWNDAGKPTTWKNVQRAYKLYYVVAAQHQPAPPTAPSKKTTASTCVSNVYSRVSESIDSVRS